MSAQEFDWWRRAVSGEGVEITADAPQSGFYKLKRHKDGDWLPVMIRMHEGELRCRVGDNSNANPHEEWTYCAKYPVAKEAAAYAFKHGKWETDAPSIGDNSGDLTLAEQITQYAMQAIGWLKKSGVKDTKSKDMAANYRAELLKLSKEADKQRETEKRPHDEAAKAVQAKWKPLIEEADGAANELRNALTVYMREEEKKLEAERRAKWEAEQEAIRKAREEADAQRAKQLADNPIAALTSPEPELPTVAAMPDPVKVQAGGQRGRKTGLREVTVYTVTDHAACLAFFAEHEDVKATIQKLAERVAKTGVSVPGLTITKDKVAA